MLPTKICLVCTTEKPISKFRMNRANGKEYVRYACRICDNLRRKTLPGYLDKLKRSNERRKIVAKVNRLNPQYRAKMLLKDCKGSDQKKKRTCDLTIEFVENMLKQKCQYCETDEIMLTLDRIDNTLGHLQTNVMTACVRCNDIRKDMPFAAWMCLVPGIRDAVQQGLFESWVGGSARNGGLSKSRTL